MTDYPITIEVALDQADKRLDQYLAAHLTETSRARVQLLIGEEKVLVDDVAQKSSFRLRGGEKITILGEAQLPAAARARGKYSAGRGL